MSMSVRARKSLTSQAVVCLQVGAAVGAGVAGAQDGIAGGGGGGDDADVPEALDMSWPDTWKKRLTYVLLAPLVVPLWLTLPDTRTPKGKSFF